MKKKALIVYHRVDFDGIFSALIVDKFLRSEFKDDISIEYLGYNYTDNIPNLGLFGNVDLLYLVDISFPADFMLDLMDKVGFHKIFWIDHHSTAISDSEKYGYQELPGIREQGRGACELCWKYFFIEELPSIISDLSDYDVWYKKSQQYWNNVVLPIQLGIRSDFGVNINNLLPINVFSPEFRLEAINKGQVIHKYLQCRWKSSVKNASFDITVAGRFKGIAIISPEFNSSMFDTVRNNYQVFCIVSPIRDSELYSCSLYSEPDGRLGDFELGMYLKENFGGGGHPTAAGCRLSKEQFLSLIINKEI